MLKLFKYKKKNWLPINGFDINAFLNANPNVEILIKKRVYKDINEYFKKEGLNGIQNGDIKYHNDYPPFDESVYLKTFTDVKLAIELKEYSNAFEHFLLYGYKEIISKKRNFIPHPKKTIDIELKKRFVSIEDAFDSEYYLALNSDVKNSNINPFTHFMKFGMYERRDPNIWFDSLMYLELNNDVKESEMSPFEHYIKHGQYEDRKPNNYLSIDMVEKLVRNNIFDYKFYLKTYNDVLNAKINPLFHYISTGYREYRNPKFDFDTFYYMRQYKINTCPLFHWLQNHNKTIPQHALVFEGDGEYNTNRKIALQIHLFYLDIAPQINRYLNNIPYKFDLLISVMSKADKVYVENYFTNIRNLNEIIVKVVENIGRDISPLLISFKSAWKEYDYICHIHTKRSLHIDWGDKWRTYLFDKLLGNPDIIRESIKYLDDNPNVALLYPENYFQVKKDTESNCNVKDINSVLSKLNLLIEDEYSSYRFAAGTMQWFRTECFESLVELSFGYKDFKNTNTNIDGTLAHAMERIFSIYAQKKHYDVKSFYSETTSTNLIQEVVRFSPTYNLGDKWMRDDPKITLNETHKLSALYNCYNSRSLNIHWVIPDFGIGAGGHMTIFRMVYFLEQLGHRQTVWIQNARNYKTPSLAKETIKSHYQPLGNNVDVHFLPDDVEWISGDIIFSTDCWTAFPVRAMSKFKKRFYFIQDYEPMFHPMGENYLIAEQTYGFGFTAITAGNWLKKKAEEHGMVAYAFPLCADKTVYFEKKSKQYYVKNKTNIAFYTRSYTPRRAVKLGLAGISELAKIHSNLHVHCFGQNDLPVVPDFEYTNHGIMSPQQLAELYNSCDIGIVFSATNYSLIPLEMMACGLPIVEMDVESTRYVFDESVVTFAKPNAVSISKSAKTLIDDKIKRRKQIKAGLEFLNEISWKKAADDINKALYLELEKENYKGIDVSTIVNSGFSPKIHATVVIPTLNAEYEIERLLNTILSQKTIFSFDILVIDSASDDKTPKILNKYAEQYENISYISIERKDFQHGKTRDMGIEKANGDYVAFLTQDALPYNELWLEELIKGFSVDEKIVGIFGKHVAYEEHSLFVKRDMKNHFKTFDGLPKVYSWSNEMPSHIVRGTLEWQMKMMFYSDNNSAICKRAWENIHYPHIDWGEDQVWAWTIVQLGLKKYYAKDAIVYHSHDDTFASRIKVSRIEKNFFYDNFGISLFKNEEQANSHLMNINNNDRDYSFVNNINKETLEHQVLLNEATVVGRSGFELTRRKKNG